jgi:hypothetical protein
MLAVAERAVGSIRFTGLIAAGITAGTGILLAVLLSSQAGDDLTSRTVLVGAMLAAAALASVLGAVTRRTTVAAGCLGFAAGLLLVTGVLALFSIGLFLVVGGLVAAGGAVGEARASGGWAAAGLPFLAGAAVALTPLLAPYP